MKISRMFFAKVASWPWISSNTTWATSSSMQTPSPPSLLITNLMPENESSMQTTSTLSPLIINFEIKLFIYKFPIFHSHLQCCQIWQFGAIWATF